MIAIDRESLILSALSARKIKGSRLMVKGLKFEELLETIEKLRAKQEIKKPFWVGQERHRCPCPTQNGDQVEI